MRECTMPQSDAYYCKDCQLVRGVTRCKMLGEPCYWHIKGDKMKKIIIGDDTYDIPDKVHFLIDDLTNKNTRLRKKRKKAYREGWEDGELLAKWEED